MMSIQSDISAFNRGSPLPDIKERPPPPTDSELEHLIAPNWMFDVDVDQLPGIHELRQDI
jgi:hypothetical protein